MRWWLVSTAAALALGACAQKETTVVKTAADTRAARRAFDGAPPVIPHEPRGACTQCHDAAGKELPIGFAPAMPHRLTTGLSGISNCNQCHVYRTTDAVFRPSEFAGLRQDLRRGQRLNPLAPPVLPHSLFMRENCRACHAGPSAREEIRCPHPERVRCTQCHVERTTAAEFRR